MLISNKKIFTNINTQKKLNRLTIQIFYLGCNILNILLGFFLSNAFSTIPGQTGDWGIIAASILVTYYEILNFIIYSQSYHFKIKKSIIISNINTIKIGIIYGLFVDAFKLGS
uniref:Uncharacterized protein ycf20 n=1 Tax=Thorea hispida TaxID=202687 RepID=A0A1Z1XAQ4_9FLOR|nr:hypothetical protein [Thorea hispida]